MPLKTHEGIYLQHLCEGLAVFTTYVVQRRTTD